MIAQLVSQISSHFIIHYHRRIARSAKESFNQRHELQSSKLHSVSFSRVSSGSINTDHGSQKRLLRNHQFGRPHRGDSEKLVVRNWVGYAVILTACCLAVCAIIGCVLPSFSLDVLGLIGVAVESGQGFEDATKHLSVFAVIDLLMDEARFLGSTSDYVGLGSMSMIFAITVLLVPLLQSIALVYQWFAPMTQKRRNIVSVANEVLQAWQYAEVYLIAIFVASWQLGPISQFMVNSYCGSLGGFFSQMVYFGILKAEDAQCFSVQSSMEEGAYVLAAGAVLLALLNTFVTKAVTQYFRDKSELEKQIADEPSASQISDGISNDSEGS